MLIWLLQLGPGEKEIRQLVFKSLLIEEEMEFGLYIFQLYLKYIINDVE